MKLGTGCNGREVSAGIGLQVGQHALVITNRASGEHIVRRGLFGRLFMLAMCTPVLFVGTNVSAQTDVPSSPAGEGDNAEVEVELPGSVVTATRLETPPSQLGSSVTVITAEDLQQRQVRMVTDALRTVRGMTIRRTGGIGSQTSIFTRGLDSDHTLVMVDGVRISDVGSPNGTPAIDHMTVDAIDRIEVVRGPQSTLYGSDAMAGVINIITKQGAGRPGGSVSIEAGSFNTWIERLSFGGREGDFDYSMSASRTDSDSFSTSVGNAEDDPYRNTTLATRLGYQFTETFSTDFYFRYIDAEIEFDSGSLPGIAQTDSRQTIARVQPRLSLFDGKWEQTFSFSYSRVDRDNDGAGFTLPSEFIGEMYSFDWQNDIRLIDGHVLTAGLEYRYEDAEFNIPFASVDADTHNLAFYVQDQITLTDDLFLTLGLRWDHHDEFGSELTGRAAIAYHVTADTILRGSIGTGFHAPTLSELYDTSFGSNNPDLDPERSFGFDVGIEQQLWDDRVVAGATFFYNDIDDMIIAVPVGFSFPNMNVDAARTMGVETFVEVNPAENIGVRLTYTYTDTKADDPNAFGLKDHSRLLRRPLHEAAVEVNWRPIPKAQLGVGVHYVGSRDDLDPVLFSTVTNDDYILVDLRGSYQVTGNVEVFGRVENLFDENYSEVLGFKTAPVALFGGVRVTF